MCCRLLKCLAVLLIATGENHIQSQTDLLYPSESPGPSVTTSPTILLLQLKGLAVFEFAAAAVNVGNHVAGVELATDVLDEMEEVAIAPPPRFATAWPASINTVLVTVSPTPDDSLALWTESKFWATRINQLLMAVGSLPHAPVFAQGGKCPSAGRSSGLVVPARLLP